MKRRDILKLASLAMVPLLPGAAMAALENKPGVLRYKVFTATRPGLSRDLPPGKESLMWVANSSWCWVGWRAKRGAVGGNTPWSSH